MVAGAAHYLDRAVWPPASLCPGVGLCSVYLYFILAAPIKKRPFKAAYFLYYLIDLLSLNSWYF